MSKTKETKWTHFWDMNSGGGHKEKWGHIYIEAPQDEAIIIFYNRFGHNPKRVTCTCCGSDYSINEGDSLEELSGYHRGCHCLKSKRQKNGLYKPTPKGMKYYYEADEKPPEGWEFDDGFQINRYQTIEQHTSNEEEVLVIRDKEIKKEERVGKVPTQGYVWQD